MLLNIADYALLIGAIGLFISLAAIMYVTRHIDWYELGVNDTYGNSPKELKQ